MTPNTGAPCSPGMRTCKFLLVNVGLSVVLYVGILTVFLRTDRHGDGCPPCPCDATAAAAPSAPLRAAEGRIVAAVLGAQNRTAAEAFGALALELRLLRESLEGASGAANGSAARSEEVALAILEGVRELRAAAGRAAAAAAATKSPASLAAEKEDAERRRAWASLQRNAESANALYANLSRTLAEAVKRRSAEPTEKPRVRRDTYSMSAACRPISKRGNSTWFAGRFNAGLKPYLTNATANLSNDTLKWFKTMQSDPNSVENLRSLVRTTMSLLPPNAPFQRATAKSCVRCAVVGNSGNVKDLRYGAFIDKHTYVFRMNNAPVQCFEHDVGQRTTHRFIYPESFRESVTKGVGLVLLAFKSKDFLWLLNKLPNYNSTRCRLGNCGCKDTRPSMYNVRFAISTTQSKLFEVLKPRSPIQKNVPLLNMKENKVLVVDPTFMKYVREAWGEKHGRYPSTGFLTSLFAIHVCDEVNLFGFGQDRHGSWHHYWSNSYSGGVAWRKTNVHDGDFEAGMLAKLDEEGIINIYRES